CVAYDPAYGYEIAHIIKDGLRRMYGSSEEHPHGEDVFYYLTVYNEPISQPAEPENLDVEGLLRGIYLLNPAPDGGAGKPRVQLLASGGGVPWVLDAQRMLAEEWGVAADVWSVTAWHELRRDGDDDARYNLLHPEEEPRVPYVTRKLEGAAGPFVAASDWMRAVPNQIARWVPGDYTVLGADGYGFADTRPAARRFFNVDAESVVVAALSAL